MRFGVILAAVFAALAAGTAFAGPADPLAWAFLPLRSGPSMPVAPSPGRMSTLPGSKLRFSEAQLDDLFAAIDWHPENHPFAPLIVRQGRQPATMACGFCHLPSGEGRPENASLAGLPATYIARQLVDMANGSRMAVRPAWGPSQAMHAIARSLTPVEIADSAAYLAKAKFVPRLRVIETQTIPSGAIRGYVYCIRPGPRVALGMRIVETPDDFDRFELRDTSVEYTAFVPLGAVARGRALALTGGDGRTLACRTCHGANLTGAIGPPLAARFPGYIFRQLLSFQTGDRHGAAGAAMKPVTAHLTHADMIDLAAYLASVIP